MPDMIVTTRDGKQHQIAFTPGVTLMQALTEGGVDEVLALCGGVCSCATCHVHIAPEFFDRFDPVSEDEDGLLEGSEHRCAQSRLSCQLRLSDDHDGLCVTVAPED